MSNPSGVSALSEIYGAINQARQLARQVERHIVEGSRPGRDELRSLRAALDSLADLLEAAADEFERQHSERN